MTQVRGRLEVRIVTAALVATLGGSLCSVAFAAGPFLPVGLHGMASGSTGHGSSGHAAAGYLGIDVRDVRKEEVITLKLKQSQGAVIQHVDHDGPAGKCGLRELDVIQQMNGQAIGDQDRLRKMLREMPPGRPVTMLIVRDGQQITVSTQMANREEVERNAWQQHLTVPPSPTPAPATESDAAPSTANHSSGFLSNSVAAVSATSHSIISTLSPFSYTGATVETLGPQLAVFFGAQIVNGKVVGVLVHSVDQHSPASDAGLRAGDVVLQVDGVAIKTSSLWYKLMRENKGKKVVVIVLRDKKEQTLILIPDSKKHSSLGPMPIAIGLEQPQVVNVAALEKLGYN
jgi:serine protease Do